MAGSFLRIHARNLNRLDVHTLTQIKSNAEPSIVLREIKAAAPTMP